MRAKREYPDWVKKYKTDKTTIKFVRGRYYLYNRLTSRRVEGKKNPQPVDEYVGVITEEGLLPAKKRRLNTGQVKVREFGFSRALELACPEEWKRIQGPDFQKRLESIILARSKNSYLRDRIGAGLGNELPRVQLGTITASLGRKFREAYGLSLDQIQELDTIYLVEVDGKRFISDVGDAHADMLSKMGIRLEVN